MNDSNKAVNTATSGILYILVFLLPLLVLGAFPNPFATPKIIFTVFCVMLILVLKSIKAIKLGSVSLNLGYFDFPVLALAIVYLVSAVVQTPNKMDAFFLPGSATIIISAALLYFVATQTASRERGLIKILMFASAVFASMIILLSSTGALANISILPAFARVATFNTLGGPLPGIIFLMSMLPIGFYLFAKKQDIATKAFVGVSIGLVIFSIIVSAFNTIPNMSTQTPSLGVSWAVTTNALQESPLLGVGPSNYITAFSRYRPLSYNSTAQWAARYTSASSFVLTSITEAGLLAFASLVLLTFSMFKRFSKDIQIKSFKDLHSEENVLYLSVILLTFSLVLFPSSPVTIVYTLIMLGLVAKHKSVKLGLFASSSHDSHESGSRFPVAIAVTPLLVGAVALTYFSVNIIGADLKYKKALDAVARNDGRSAYDALRDAIGTNPYVDRYHVTYAQVNLALANSVAQNPNLTDEQRNTVAQLIQQAIREGKTSVALNPQRASNWEILGSVYRAIIPLAKGADVYAVQTYSQAVLLDPINVNTRISLGGIYYAAKAYQDAIDIFKLAVRTKPDYANAHYNLGVAYREAGEIDKAIAEIETVMSLVQLNSDDYSLAQKTLKDLQDKKKTKEAENSTNLTTPTQVVQADTQIELPEDSAPPEPEVSPTLAPTPTDSPVPSAETTPTQ
ncbi:hypothetical protein C4564_04590 [Candidatus Microgenomates bacterium]|nr:MAG: hypothetical protein C4564_04590 [Candidatus Microgenomates bacterium]